jgi:tetratricopeptide (TPR) repeat protein
VDISAKYYKKAVEYYNEGYLDKALFFCEKSISNSLRSSAAVNLKGLLLYLKGELTEAEALWTLNYDYNKDQVAKKYLENLKMDKEYLDLYNKAQISIGEMDFKVALVHLEQCLKSDFNAIGVNNALCIVYIHMGRYEEAKACINKVLSIDKNDKISRENTKLLIEYKVINGKNRKKFAVISVVLLIAFVYMAVLMLDKEKSPDIALNESNNTAINEEVLKAEEKEPVQVEPEIKKEIKELFPREQFISVIDEKDYEKLINLLTSSDLSALEDSEKELYIKGEKLMISEGVSYFYKKGRALHLENKYKEALEQYAKVERYAEEVHLYEDIVYMIGDCYQFLNNRDKAIEYYKKYLTLNSDSDYDETVLYQLVLIYKDTDTSIAKKYAEEIVNKYQDSIYNNSVVQSVIKSK